MDRTLHTLTASLQDRHWWFAARRSILCGLAQRITPPDARVVDVGCGTGHILAGMPDHWHRTGLDPSSRAIEIGRARYPEIDLRLGSDPEIVGDRLRTADLVLCCDVLEHVAAPGKLLAEITAHVPVGGQLILTVPAGMELWSLHDVQHGHHLRYEREDLEALLDGLPLRPRLMWPFNRRLYPVVRLVRLLTRIRGRTLGEGRTDLRLPPRPLNALLRRIFAGEEATLCRVLDRPERRPRLPGVSWVTVLERTADIPETGSDPGRQTATRQRHRVR